MKYKRFLSFLLAGFMLFSFMSVLPNDSFRSFTVVETNAAEGRLYDQNDSYWKTVTFTKYASSGSSMYTSGCGIFSFCNAIYALNGNKIDAKSLAAWAVDNGSYQPGNGGLYREAFYNKVQAGFGSKYEFKIDGQYYGTISDSRLINHLQNGGVVAVHVSSHFMAVTGYNASNGTFHVIESAVYSGRGLQADSWVTASKLSSGSTDVDWYALISKSSTITELSAPQLSINKTTASTSDTIKISWNNVKNATWYYLSLFKDGVLYIDKGMDNNLSYSNKLPTGDYIAYVCAGDGAITSEASSISFSVYNTAPTSPQLTINKNLLSMNENVEIQWENVKNAEWYYISLYKDGELYVDKGLDNNCSYSSKLPAGDYIAYICAGNNVGTSAASSINFSVYDSKPSSPNLSIHKSLLSIDENVEIKWNAVKNAEWYYISLYKDGELYDDKGLDNNCSYSNKLPAGDYIAYICAGNNVGTSAASSINFSVYDSKPSSPNLSIHKSLLSIDENVEIKWNAVKNAEWYYISLYKDGELYVDKGLDNNCSYSEKLPAGEYIAYICAGNSAGTSTASSVAFQVVGKLNVILNANGGICSTESITVTYGETYNSLPEPSRSGYIFDGWFTAASGGKEVTASTIVTANQDHELYAHWEKNKVVGDVNADGTFNVADVVMLQKWLTCTSDVALIEWQAADLYEDGIIDVVDLCMMKKRLING